MDLIHEMAGGWVALPVLDALKQQGILELLSQHTLQVNDVAQRRGADVMRLRAALGLLTQLGYVDSPGPDLYSSNARTVAAASVPGEVLALGKLSWFDDCPPAECAVWQRRLMRCIDADADDPCARLWDAAILAPLLAGFGWLAPDTLEQACPPGGCAPVWQTLQQLFVQRGWAEQRPSGWVLTLHGRKILLASSSLAVVIAHAPLLQNVSALLFEGAPSLGVEAHSRPPSSTEAWAYQRVVEAFSGRAWVEPARWLMEAAAAGRFAAPGAWRSMRQWLASAWPQLPDVSQRDYTVRHPVVDDLPQLIELDRLSQPAGLHTPPQIIEWRVRNTPLTLMVLVAQGRIAAALHAQRIEGTDALRDTTYTEVHQLHRVHGMHLQLLGLYVFPEMAGRGYSDALIECMLTYAAMLGDVQSVVGVTRCAEFVHQRESVSLEDYVCSRNAQGEMSDPMLHFHVSRGAVVREVLPGFRVGDSDNNGAGVLIEYAWPAIAATVHEADSTREVVALSRAQLEQLVQHVAMQLSTAVKADAYSPSRPWMEMGLGSLQLLELRRRLSGETGLRLEATFFFSCPTPDAAIAYLVEHLGVAPGSGASASRGPSREAGIAETKEDSIAIIGMACRLPGGISHPDQLWTALMQGQSLVGPMPQARRALRPAETPPFPWHAGFLSDIDRFDAGFFRISPHEAQWLDPQQRLLLEVAWEALESAGLAPGSLKGLANGIFVGLMGSEYAHLLGRSPTDELEAHFATGAACSVAAGRLAYFLDWRGPALTVDTACSSSLVAVHLACRSLQAGESKIALAAGANALLDDRVFQAFEKAGMLSPTGLCHTFDQAADGYVRAEGCAVVVLKRFCEAQADGDPILATIAASAINQDGGGAGLTAPNPHAQQSVIETALLRAGLPASAISYLEAHGTGTPLGDPIEVQAAAQVLGRDRSLQQPLLIGSIKSLLGHLEAAAGMAGLIKTVLSMQHSTIPGQLHFHTPNAHIPWRTLPIRVPETAQPWPDPVKRAGVSSFGFSGTNAHLIVQAHDAAEAAVTATCKPMAIVLSARTAEQLTARARQLLVFLEHTAVDVVALAYTLQVGRDAMAMRLGFIASTLTEVKTRLADLCSEQPGDQTPQPTPASPLALSLARWLQGDEVDWHALHDLPAPRKLALPTYPFADERYWLPEETSDAPLQDAAAAQLLTWTAGWERVEASSQEPAEATLSTLWLSADAAATDLPVRCNALGFDEHCTTERLGARLKDQAAWQQLVWRVPASDSAPLMGFRLIQALLALGYDRQPLRLTVLTEQAHALEPFEQVDPFHASVVGLMGTLAREYPHWQLRLIDLPAGRFIAPDAWLQGEVDAQRNVQIWRDGVWYRHRLLPTELPPLGVSTYRRGGVYVVLGGAGGLGRVFSEYVIQRYQAQVIWLGRRAEDARITEQCARLGMFGPAPVYLQADAQDCEALVRARAVIVERYGVVHGVVHAPMVLADNPLARMDEPSFLAAFLAKTTVVNLDAVFGSEGLDFFAFFSSIASFLKTPGAANYVAGCCFVDAYAHNLGSRTYAVKLMHWGPWFDTGGICAPGYRTFMQQLGFESLGADEAMAAFEQLLSGPLDSVVVARAWRDRLNEVLAPATVPTLPQPAVAPSSPLTAGGRGYRAEMHGMSLVEAIVWDLIEQARTVSKLPREAIKAAANLSEYGFDSILLVRLARRLSEHYGLTLWPPLFFSYPSLDQLAEYLVQFHQPLMATLYEPPGSAGALAAPGAAMALDAYAQADEPIAIIGLSGRFAGARSAEQFWEILRDGRSVVQPFAPERLADASRPRWLAAMPGVAEFDPLFFEIAPREAALIDPRQRLLMQETWRALEDAAYGPVQLKQQTISTFVGVETGDYGRLIGSQNTLTANHDAILAARLAYFLDLSGPTLAVNTACSSSLVALHQGCLSLRSGESDTAIVAAVNLLAGTQLTDQMADAGMLAPDGVCHAFGKHAQGMAPGEAAVVLVLKRLSRAQADGDPIRAVIVGSGINGDGKTQGITAPNGRAQSSLFRKVYERYQVNPDDIEYVVSHGTGTPLGDPVEINALCDAFAPFTQRRQYCAITSNKPNVGHGLAAAGLVSVVNLLKAFEHETIPASLNCEQASDYVTWADTPFYLNTTNTPWPATSEKPRLGAVSAFGMSGTNAHVLLRGPEACASAELSIPRGPVVLVVSAKSQAALHGRIEDLIHALGAMTDNAALLQRVGHTLLNGRQHFAWRCAIVAESLDQALSIWRQALRGEQSAALYQGQLARDFAENLALRDEGRRLIEQAGRETSPGAMQALLSRVAELYCQGVELPWADLFDPRARGRLHLPTYPFEAEPFWAVKPSEACAPAAETPLPASAGPWHSSLRLTGEEAFLRDHVVLGQKIVPGVVQLEWVMTAITRCGGDAPFRLEHVTWLRPVTVDVAQDVHIVLVRTDEHALDYEIYGTEQAQKRLYSQGRASRLSAPQTAPAPWLDMASLRARCTRTRDGATCYRDFAEAGLDYGSSFQTLQSLDLGDDIAVGRLHASADSSSVLDGALQASVILAGGAGVTMPFSLGSFQQWGPLTGALCVVVQRVVDDGAATRRFDIDLVDVSGTVAARFAGFSGRCATVDPGPACAATAGLMLASRWEREPPGAPAEATDPQLLVQIGGDAQGAPVVSWQADESSDALIERLTPHLPLKQVVWYVPVAGTQLAVMGLRLLKALLALGYAVQPLGLTVVTRQAQGLSAADEVDPEQASVHGLIGAAAKEYAHWQVRLLDLAPGDALAHATLLAQPAQPYGNARLWRHGAWHRQRLVPCQWPGVCETRRSVFREGGVYVVLGGAGGLGVAFSEYLIKRYRAQLVWLGRRAADEPIRQQCARLAEFGPRPLYVQADGTHHDALELACVQITERFGRVHGVVHAAIVLADQSLAGMDENGFVAALSAKTLTAQNLTAVFGQRDLDFLLFFGSLQSFLKAPGQSNYAAGCCYVDAWAHTLATRRDPPSFPIKVMQWGYWGSVGVVASPFYVRRMAQKGLGSIEPAQAMAALEAFLLAPVSQLVFLQPAPASTLAPELGFDPLAVPEPAPIGERMSLPEQPLIPVPSALVVRGYKELERHLAQLIWARMGQLGHHEHLEPKYQRWCQATERLLNAAGLHRDNRAASWQVLWEQWRTYREQVPGDTGLSAHVRVADAVLHALPSVLSGQQAATAVLFPEGQLDLLEGVYGNHPIADYFNAVLGERLQAYVRARLAHDPHFRLRILEVGAGTGATSASLLNRLSPFEAHIDEYCYTDISRVFLAHALARYATRAPYLRTQLLDIEVSPLTQGFAGGHYDVVIAANVLHATRDMRHTLRNVKTLLKGNGLLLLNELSGPSVFQHLVFGLLDGWWLAEDRALRVADSPALHADAWREVLNSEGFTAVNLLAQDADELGQQIVEALSDARVFVEQSAAPGPGSATRPAVEPSPLPADARQVIRECVAQSLGLKDTQLHDDQTFVSCGLDSISSVALVNVINTRLSLKLPATVVFDYPTIERLDSYLKDTLPTPVAPPPVVERAPRQSAVVAPPPRLAAAEHAVTRYRRILLERPGSIDEIRVVEQTCAALDEYDVRIAVQAFSLNFGDLLCVKGLYPTQPAYPFTPGYEASGIVTAIGPSVCDVAVGDAVVALAGAQFGAQATVITCPQHLVFRCPAGLSFEQSCAVPVAAFTVIECFRKAQLQAGERILIQTATGAVGLMAVQLAQSIGAQVYATAGSQEKLDYLAALGVSHAINYREDDFERVIHQLTHGEGVDVVLNMLAGDALQKGLKCLAAGGRYVEIAMTALKSARAIDVSILDDNQSMHSVDIRRLGLQRPQALRAAWQEMERLLAQGSIAPTLDKVFAFDDIHQAYRRMEQRQHIGKIVVRVEPQPRVSAPGVPEAQAGLEPIAIIGMSGRFAAANNVDELWDALAQGQDLVGPVTRWDLSRAGTGEDKSACRDGGFLADIDCFDPMFFNLSSMEALAMEPQQRLFMEEVWHALEDAGYAGKSVEGSRCAVYAGCSTGDYLPLLGAHATAQAFWGNAASVIPARMAFHLNWQGPAIATDTACSSSLVALHQACEALRTGDISMAVAGGVFVQCTERLYAQGNRAGMLSTSGRCRTFDANADGFVPGEAVAAVVLKPLRQARDDGDAIYGVVYGSGINYDGATNGLTAPSGPAQTRLARAVYQRFAINPNDIQWVETHGTGTTLGDPIEVTALTQAFAQPDAPQARRAIGSIKSNIGHTATAAGIAGVIKVLLSLQHRKIPASLHFAQGNRHIDFEHSPFYVPTTLTDWHVAKGQVRRAAVSSFGFSGTNAHAVIGEAPEQTCVPLSREPRLIVVSARSEQQLRVLVQRLIANFQADAGDMAAISHTLLVGRRHHAHRLACVATQPAELVERFSRWLAGAGAQGLVIRDACAAIDVQAAQRLGQQQLQDLQAGQRSSEPQVADETLRRLGELYVQGIDLPWEQLFDKGARRRIRLAGYPFARERYWPSASEPAAQALGDAAEARPAAQPAQGGATLADIREYVRSQFKQVLLLTDEKLGDDTHFDYYGMDSIVRMTLLAAINSRFGLALENSALVDHPTVEQLIAYISTQCQLHRRPSATAGEFVHLSGMSVTPTQLQEAWEKMLQPK